MKFTASHAGKWVATKGDKVVATGKTFQEVKKKISSRKDRDSLWFDLVPKGILTGFSV